MELERFQQTERLYHAARPLPKEEREQFLAAACIGDPALCAEVESLLQHDQGQGSFLESPALKVLAQKESGDHAAPGKRDSAPERPPGLLVSHYRILEKLGGGGMGVVFAAEDIRLGRRVALKFLPEEAVQDTLSLQRFEREARSASALDHNNICPVFEFGEHNGRPFIVMPLLEGRTLKELIANGKAAAASAAESQAPGQPLSMNRIVELALQIAAGLQAAHEKGMIHRDIKPANIFVTYRDEVKILDFGLAKPVASHLAQPPADAPSIDGNTGLPITSPVDWTQGLPSHVGFPSDEIEVNILPEPETPSGAPLPGAFARNGRSQALTFAGAAMGTLGYMSPEQVRGEPLDARTDIFSLGVVLCEMATGKLPFTGKMAASLLPPVLDDLPPAPDQFHSTLPPLLAQIIAQALQRDRQLRYPSAAGMIADLQRLKRDLESRRTELALMAAPGQIPRVPRGKWAKRWWGTGMTVLAIFVVAAGYYFRLREQPSPPPLREKQLTFNSPENAALQQAISPDGKRLAYADGAGIHVLTLTSGDDHLLPSFGMGMPLDLSWFPDGKELFFSGGVNRDPSIWKISSHGNNLTRLRDHASSPALSADGLQVVFTDSEAHEIWVMDAQGQNAHKVVTENEGSLYVPRWSPDSRYIAYIRANPAGDRLVIETRSLTGGPPSPIVSGAKLFTATLCWTQDWRLVFVDSRAANKEREYEPNYQADIWSIPIERETGKAAGNPEQLTHWENGYYPASVAVTANGKTISTLRARGQENIYLGELSHHGTRLQKPRRLTLNDRYSFLSAWTPDGHALLFDSNRNGRLNVLQQDLARQSPERIFGTSTADAWQATFVPGGRWILYGFEPHPKPGAGPGTAQLMRAPPGGGSARIVLDKIERDGEFFVCPLRSGSCVLSRQEGDELVFYALDPLKGKGKELARTQIDTANHHGWTTGHYCWDISPDGSQLAVITGISPVIRVLDLNRAATREVPVPVNQTLRNVQWSADGKAFFVPLWSPGGNRLVRVTLGGNVQTLLDGGGTEWVQGSLPSRDGRYLAFTASTWDSNVWILDNF